MAASTSGHRSAYRSLADQLRDQLRSGELGEGQRLPTEGELVERHRLSRQTVRRAYLELVTEGIVERIPGRGTYPVRRGHYQRSFSSIEELLALSEDTELEVLEPLSRKADPEIAMLLGLQFDEVLHVGFRRLHLELAFCHTDVHLPPRMGDHLRSADFLRTQKARSRATVLGLLDGVLPHGVIGAKQVITAVPAPRRIAAHIDCKVAQPVMRIERLHFDDLGRPIERCVSYFNPDRYQYRQQLNRRRAVGGG